MAKKQQDKTKDILLVEIFREIESLGKIVKEFKEHLKYKESIRKENNEVKKMAKKQEKEEVKKEEPKQAEISKLPIPTKSIKDI